MKWAFLRTTTLQSFLRVLKPIFPGDRASWLSKEPQRPNTLLKWSLKPLSKLSLSHPRRKLLKLWSRNLNNWKTILWCWTWEGNLSRSTNKFWMTTLTQYLKSSSLIDTQRKQLMIRLTSIGIQKFSDRLWTIYVKWNKTTSDSLAKLSRLS